MATQHSSDNLPKSHWLTGEYRSPALRAFVEEYMPSIIRHHAQLGLESVKRPDPSQPLGYPIRAYIDLAYENVRIASYPIPGGKEEAIKASQTSTENITASSLSSKLAGVEMGSLDFILRKPLGADDSSRDFRLHLNVHPSVELIKGLDAFTAAHGMLYKVSSSLDRWYMRHDPVVLYSHSPFTESQLQEMKAIAAPHVRQGAQNQPIVGKEISTGITLSDIHHVTKEDTINAAKALDANYGDKIESYLLGRVSSAEINVISQITAAFKDFLSKNPELKTAKLSEKERDNLRVPSQIIESCGELHYEASDKYLEVIKPYLANESSHTAETVAMPVMDMCLATMTLFELKKAYAKHRDGQTADRIAKYQELYDVEKERAIALATLFGMPSEEATRNINTIVGQCLAEYGKTKAQPRSAEF